MRSCMRACAHGLPCCIVCCAALRCVVALRRCVALCACACACVCVYTHVDKNRGVCACACACGCMHPLGVCPIGPEAVCLRAANVYRVYVESSFLTSRGSNVRAASFECVCVCVCMYCVCVCVFYCLSALLLPRMLREPSIEECSTPCPHVAVTHFSCCRWTDLPFCSLYCSSIMLHCYNIGYEQ